MSPARVTICLLVLFGSGVAHGLVTHRWRAAADFDGIQVRLSTVAVALGPWMGRDIPLAGADDLGPSGIRAHLSRDYRDGLTGRVVRVLVVAGPPGPIAAHTPDVCFQGTGYEMSAPQEVISLDGGESRLWAATFTKPGPVRSQLRVFWAWNGGSGWEAPEHRTARYKYTFQPVLYKIYLTTDVDRPGVTESSRSAEDLAGRLLPDLVRVLAGQP
ncbi:MAG TPA: exosortase-associated EpsI family protein [Urbifossiella sp.]|nr:exosortase-associated EpsI family protein [Urbifossiella sp.]